MEGQGEWNLFFLKSRKDLKLAPGCYIPNFTKSKIKVRE